MDQRIYKALVENAMDAFYVHDLQGRFVLVNHAACQALGYTREELLHLSVSDVSANYDPSRVASLLHKVREEGAQTFPDAHRRKDATTFPVEVKASALDVEGAQAPLLLSIVRDVSERDRSEQDLRHRLAFEELIGRLAARFINIQNEQIELGIEQALEDLARFGEVDRCCWFEFNGDATRFSCIAEWTSPELPNYPPRPRNVPVTELPDMMGHLRRGEAVGLTRMDEFDPVDHLFRERMEMIGVVSFLAVPVVRMSRLVGFLGMATFTSEHAWERVEETSLRVVAEIFANLTERRLTELALRESERNYRELFNAIDDYIFTHDMSGRILSVNPAVCRGLGYAEEELVGRPFIELALSDKDAKNFPAHYAEQVSKTGQVEQVVRLRAADGTAHYIEIKTTVMQQQGGEPFVSGSGRDITERVVAERKLERLQEQLVQAQKMEAVGTLASGVAHDFNNLLHAISGYAQLALSLSPEEGKLPGYLEKIEEVVGRAAELISNLLTFSRREEAQLTPVALNEEVRRAVAMLERTIPRMIRIETQLAGSLRPMEGLSSQLQQVVLNLCTNARDAMDSGGVITIETSNEPLDDAFCREHPPLEPGMHLRLRVRDTGCGMDEKTLRHIFEPFFTTKEVGEGTGLGLSTVFGVVKSHRGAILCESESGLGTTFDLYFPALLFHEKAAQTATADDRPTGEGERLLVVDDENSVLDVVSEGLSLLGYEVIVARSGEEALESYATLLDDGRPVDLVVMDLSMPGIGGEQCMRELLALDSHLKVVITSGYSAEGLEGGLAEAGAVGFVQKPYSLTLLAQSVRQALDE